MNRALAWLLGGFVLLVLGLVAIAPELLGDLEAAGGTLAVALGAVIPALLVAAIFVSVRRRRGGPDRARGGAVDGDHPDHVSRTDDRTDDQGA